MCGGAVFVCVCARSKRSKFISRDSWVFCNLSATGVVCPTYPRCHASALLGCIYLARVRVEQKSRLIALSRYCRDATTTATMMASVYRYSRLPRLPLPLPLLWACSRRVVWSTKPFGIRLKPRLRASFFWFLFAVVDFFLFMQMLLNKPIYVALAQRREVRRTQLEAQFAQRTGMPPRGLPMAGQGMYGMPYWMGAQPGMPQQPRLDPVWNMID